MAFPSTYPTYKPSGTSSLGDVPEHWDVVQLGRIGVFSKGSGGTKDDEVPTGIPCVRYGDLYTTHKYFITQARSFIAPKKATQYTKIQRGDILFPTSGETIEDIGRSAANLIDSPVCCGGDLIIFRSTVPVEPRFAGYALDCPHSQDQKSRMGRGVSIMHIYSNQLKYLWLALPPLDEQGAIVRYLDDADQRIFAYVSAKETLIHLLEEMRQAVMQQAVTRGLDPSVPLKPSGVEWLGDVPGHWTIGRLKAVAQIRYGLGQPPKESETGLPLIRATNVSRGHIVEKDLLHVDPHDVPAGRDAFLREKEIIVVRSGAYTADSAIIPERYTGSVTGYDMVVTVTEAMPEFVAAALLSKYLRDDQLIIASSRAAQPHLNAEELGSAVLLLPPLSEQSSIVQHLHKANSDINKAIDRARRQINLMNEYRTRLIADVVTGKLNVRESAEQLPSPNSEGPLTEHQSVSNPTINAAP